MSQSTIENIIFDSVSSKITWWYQYIQSREPRNLSRDWETTDDFYCADKEEEKRKKFKKGVN